MAWDVGLNALVGLGGLACLYKWTLSRTGLEWYVSIAAKKRMELLCEEHPWKVCVFGPLREECLYRLLPLTPLWLHVDLHSPMVPVVLVLQAAIFGYRHKWSTPVARFLNHGVLGFLFGAAFFAYTEATHNPFVGLLAAWALHSVANTFVVMQRRRT